MSITQEAATAPHRPPLAVLFAATMEMIGELVDDGVPPPNTITTVSSCEVLVSIGFDDLGAWVTALDLPAPEVDARETTDHEWIDRWAWWSEIAQAGIPFRLMAQDRVPVLDAALAAPACWQAEHGMTG